MKRVSEASAARPRIAEAPTKGETSEDFNISIVSGEDLVSRAKESDSLLHKAEKGQSAAIAEKQELLKQLSLRDRAIEYLHKQHEEDQIRFQGLEDQNQNLLKENQSLRNQHQEDQGHIDALQKKKQAQQKHIQELEEANESFLINTVETYKATYRVLSNTKTQPLTFLSSFRDKAEDAFKEKDSNRLLALVRQGWSKAAEILDKWRPLNQDKAEDKNKKNIIYVSRPNCDIRGEQLAAHVMETGSKHITSREARKFIAGKEGKDISRREGIRALYKATKWIPNSFVEVYNHMVRLVVRDKLVKDENESNKDKIKLPKSLFRGKNKTINRVNNFEQSRHPRPRPSVSEPLSDGITISFLGGSGAA